MARNYIAVIGHPCRDTTHFPDGRTERSLGGIVFGSLAMAALARDLDIDVVPVIAPGTDTARDIYALLGSAGCRLDAVRTVPQNTQHSEITVTGNNERTERATGALPHIELAHTEPWLTGHAVAINFITGCELRLDTLRRIHERASGPVIVDYHAIAQQIEPDGRRVYCRRADWAAWIGATTVVQMNRHEAEAIAGRTLESPFDAAAFARELLHLGPTAAVVTLDRDGAAGAERAPDGFATYLVDAVRPPEIVDTVGCGDVFHAALALGWVRYGRLLPALELSSAAAGLHAGYVGITGIGTLDHAWSHVRTTAAVQ